MVTSPGGTLERDRHTSYDLPVVSLVRMARRTYPFLREGDPGSPTVIASVEARSPPVEPGSSCGAGTGRDARPRLGARGPGHRRPGRSPRHTRFREQVDAAVEHGRYDSFDEGGADARDAVPLGRLGDPEAFGDVIAVLVSESSEPPRDVAGTSERYYGKRAPRGVRDVRTVPVRDGLRSESSSLDASVDLPNGDATPLDVGLVVNLRVRSRDDPDPLDRHSARPSGPRAVDTGAVEVPGDSCGGSMFPRGTARQSVSS